MAGDALADLGDAQVHAQAVFGVVFKEGVSPGRALSQFVFAVGHGGCAGAPDGGAAGGVGNHHAITEELGDEFGVGGFTAAGAGAGEFEEGLFELAAFDGFFVHGVGFFGDGEADVPEFDLAFLGFDGFHDEGFFFGGADVSAVAAAGAV